MALKWYASQWNTLNCDYLWFTAHNRHNSIARIFAVKKMSKTFIRPRISTEKRVKMLLHRREKTKCALNFGKQWFSTINMTSSLLRFDCIGASGYCLLCIIGWFNILTEHWCYFRCSRPHVVLHSNENKKSNTSYSGACVHIHCDPVTPLQYATRFEPKREWAFFLHIIWWSFLFSFVMDNHAAAHLIILLVWKRKCATDSPLHRRSLISESHKTVSNERWNSSSNSTLARLTFNHRFERREKKTPNLLFEIHSSIVCLCVFVFVQKSEIAIFICESLELLSLNNNCSNNLFR